MMKLKLISFFLCLLMTLQMLPIAQIGMMLSTNQWTEELPHSANESGKLEASHAPSPFLPPLTNNHFSLFAENKARAYMNTSAKIPFNHSTDVVSPPPDIA